MILANRSFQVDKIKGLQVILCKFWKTPFEEVAQPCFNAFDAALRKFDVDPDITVIRPMPTANKNSIETKIHTAEQMALAVLPLKWKGMCQIWTLAISNGKLYGRIPPWLKMIVENSEGNLEEILNTSSSKSQSLGAFKADDTFLHLNWPGEFQTPNTSLLQSPQFHRFSTLLSNQENEGRTFMSLEIQK